jgi:hypothetical protein
MKTIQEWRLEHIVIFEQIATSGGSGSLKAHIYFTNLHPPQYLANSHVNHVTSTPWARSDMG